MGRSLETGGHTLADYKLKGFFRIALRPLSCLKLKRQTLSVSIRRTSVASEVAAVWADTECMFYCWLDGWLLYKNTQIQRMVIMFTEGGLTLPWV